MRLLLAALVLVSSVSFAQTSSGTERGRQPTTTVIFDENDVVTGELQSPSGEVIHAPPAVEFGSLIRVRANFADKLMRSVNDLR